ncbi:teichoic acid translocation permease protein TagG [Abditibacteriota bacterium]|nr:teichoic acid translocation permease protein TagG [Abditibacteriota bacterium]
MNLTSSDLTTPIAKPHLSIRPPSGWQALDLREVWQFRDLLLSLAARDVKLRYRQTALGALWVLLQPLLGAGILSFVFNRLASLPTGSVPPILFSYVGMLSFTLFSSTLSKASSSLVGNSQLISKVYFPRLILPLSTVLSSLVDFGVGLLMLVVLMAIYRIPPTLALLSLPFWLGLIILLSLGFGLFFSAVMVTYRDVQYVLPVLISFLTFASPIAYTATFVASKTPVGLHTFYFLLNPLASLIDVARWAMLGSGQVLWNYVGWASLISIAAFVGGLLSFRQMEQRFADVI